MSAGHDTGPLGYVVDDDDAVRDSLRLLFKSVGMPVRAFADAESFLAGLDPDRPGCLICDVRMPGTGGLELQARMEATGLATPIIFITGHGDVPMAVDAMRKGAVDFIQKPFDDDELLDRVRQALSGDTDNPA